ncbi:hypothetical protein AF085_11730, partial [Listeria monocytogenes]|nr:hypothetical protein [Listeria monocytogenes]
RLFFYEKESGFMKLKKTKYVYLAIVSVFVVAASMYFFSGEHNENKEELKQELVKMKPQEEQVKAEQKVDENFSAQEEIEQIAQGFIANFFDDKASFLEQSLPFMHESLVEKAKKEPRNNGVHVMNIHKETIDQVNESYHASFTFELSSAQQGTASSTNTIEELEQAKEAIRNDDTTKKYRCVFIFQKAKEEKWLIYDYQLTEIENEQPR